MAEEAKTCFGCGNAAPRSAMLEDEDGHWWHLYCAGPKGIKEKRANQMAEKMKYPVPANQTQILDRFVAKGASSDQRERMLRLGTQFAFIAESILGQTPPSREQSLALTHLEEAAMWANKAITHNETPEDK